LPNEPMAIGPFGKLHARVCTTLIVRTAVSYC